MAKGGINFAPFENYFGWSALWQERNKQARLIEHMKAEHERAKKAPTLADIKAAEEDLERLDINLGLLKAEQGKARRMF